MPSSATTRTWPVSTSATRTVPSTSSKLARNRPSADHAGRPRRPTFDITAPSAVSMIHTRESLQTSHTAATPAWPSPETGDVATDVVGVTSLEDGLSELADAEGTTAADAGV